jgi:alpha-D-xyloside xylohydrolase
VLEGPGWRDETHDMLSLPLLVRPGAVLALGAGDDRPDYDYADGVTLQVYELADEQQSRVSIPALAGGVDMTFTVERQGGTITVERQGATKAWRLQLVGIDAIASVEGGSAGSDPSGLLVTAKLDAERLVIRLG